MCRLQQLLLLSKSEQQLSDTMNTDSFYTRHKDTTNTAFQAKSFQVQGHRGGYQPENTMKCFQMALESGLEAIELDVWLTKDKVPVIIHGGDGGELNHHFHDLKETTYIFDLTYEQLLTYDMGEGEQVPTLQSLLQLAGKRMYINIEVKAPHEPIVRERYDFRESIRLVHMHIVNSGLEGQCCVSSFDHDILGELENLNQLHSTTVDSLYLYNYYDTDELPAPEVYATRGMGINISSTKLTKEIVDICHANGKKVGVWIDRSVSCEDDAFYLNMFKMGVDFFCSDYPDRVREAYKRHISTSHMHSTLFDQLSGDSIKLYDSDGMRMRFQSSNDEKLHHEIGLGQHQLDTESQESTAVSQGGSNFNSDNVADQKRSLSPELMQV